MVEVNDKWLRFLLPAVPTTLLLYVFLTSSSGINASKAVALLSIPAVCEVSRFVIYQGHRWSFSGRQKVKRNGAVLAAGIAAVALVLLLVKILRNYLVLGRLWSEAPSMISVNGRAVSFGLIGTAFVYAVIFFPLIFLAYETLFHFARLRAMERQKSRLEKEKLQAELQQLKGIVNPHFLFNNLNSLSALISENPPQAEAFLNELTNVFRYLLRNNNAELSTVAEELQFIRSYYHLLRTRYGQGILLDVNVADDLTVHLLPPLTLQLLVENAVKHNRVQREAPLRIVISGTGGPTLVVQNSLRKREQAVESTGIGLHSINTRLRLLNQPALTIEQDEQLFRVKIPLLESVASPQSLSPQAAVALP